MSAAKPSPEDKEFHTAVSRAMRKAAQRARETARMYGTPIYVWHERSRRSGIAAHPHRP